MGTPIDAANALPNALQTKQGVHLDTDYDTPNVDISPAQLDAFKRLPQSQRAGVMGQLTGPSRSALEAAFDASLSYEGRPGRRLTYREQQAGEVFANRNASREPAARVNSAEFRVTGADRALYVNDVRALHVPDGVRVDVQANHTIVISRVDGAPIPPLFANLRSQPCDHVTLEPVMIDGRVAFDATLPSGARVEKLGDYVEIYLGRIAR